MSDLYLLLFAFPVAVFLCWILFRLANRLARTPRHRRANAISGIIGAVLAAFAVLGSILPLPPTWAEDYLVLIFVAITMAGATAGVVLSSVVGWSCRMLVASGLLQHLVRRKKPVAAGGSLGMLVGAAVGAWVLVHPHPLEEWPVVLASLAVGGVFGAGLSSVLPKRMCVAACGLGVLAIVGCAVWAHVYLPRSSSLRFHPAIAKADRLVVRHGGFDCCGPVDGQRVLFEVVDPAELAEVRQHLQFVSELPGPGCLCCGYPGLDWYRGETRVALAAVQHRRAIRWNGFQGDAPLTEESSQWLAQWLNAHGITDDLVQYDP